MGKPRFAVKAPQRCSENAVRVALCNHQVKALLGKQFPKLNNEQAKLVNKMLRKALGPEITDMLDKSGINSDHLIRFQYISSLCKNTREQKNISLKQASEQLKIPQYRLREIESGSIKAILSDLLDRYIDFLGLSDAFHDWLKDNEDIYKSIQGNRRK